MTSTKASLYYGMGSCSGTYGKDIVGLPGGTISSEMKILFVYKDEDLYVDKIQDFKVRQVHAG
jgi:hypothetical protein